LIRAVLQLEPRLLGRTQASSVIVLDRSRLAESATVTQSLTPSKLRAEPFLPAVVQAAPEIEPVFALPESSRRLLPLPASKP